MYKCQNQCIVLEDAKEAALKYTKVHMATRWTVRHGFMLLWYKDLMNVTEIGLYHLRV